MQITPVLASACIYISIYLACFCANTYHAIPRLTGTIHSALGHFCI